MTWLRSPHVPTSLVIAASACAVAPDVDVLFFRFGVPYGSMLGHRGITHSLPFAAVLGAVVARGLRHRTAGIPPLASWLYLFIATASHGALDALTNGGHGVAFFAPLSDARYFFPVRPIEVSPLSVSRFFGGRGIAVIASELVWVWLPGLALAVLGLTIRRLRRV